MITILISFALICKNLFIMNRENKNCVHKYLFSSRYRVRLGEYNTNTEIDCVNLTKGTGLLPDGRNCADPPLNVDVVRIFIHPSYNRITRKNDVALLRLAKNISYTGYIDKI